MNEAKPEKPMRPRKAPDEVKPPQIGGTTTVDIGSGRIRPVIITSVNLDGTVNGRVILEPADDPRRDAQEFYRNLKA